MEQVGPIDGNGFGSCAQSCTRSCACVGSVDAGLGECVGGDCVLVAEGVCEGASCIETDSRIGIGHVVPCGLLIARLIPQEGWAVREDVVKDGGAL